MRTITQRTTLPFLIAESGAASFTEAVTTSPNPARSPRSPPRGKMHDNLRAPLLSATSRSVLIPTIVASLLGAISYQLSAISFGLKSCHHLGIPKESKLASTVERK